MTNGHPIYLESRRSITAHYANDECRRQIEKSPLAQIEMSLSAVSVGKHWADEGDYDEPDGDRPDERPFLARAAANSREAAAYNCRHEVMEGSSVAVLVAKRAAAKAAGIPGRRAAAQRKTPGSFLPGVLLDGA
jgi:hypothetical protein